MQIIRNLKGSFKVCTSINSVICSRGTSGAPLAVGTDSKKFQFVGYSSKSVCGGKPRLNFMQETFIYLHHGPATTANEVMMVIAVTVADQLKSRRAVAKINPPDHLHFFKQVHRTVNCGQVTLVLRNGGKYFFGGEWAELFTQDVQN
jgi:hypothetical protein